MPWPRVDLIVRVEGGVSRATLRRPAGVPVGVEIEGGATDLRIDGDHIGAAGGPVRRRAGEETSGSAEIDVCIYGGASGLTVTALGA